MRKIIPLLSVVLSLISNQVHATHAMGGEITYECLGANTYRVRLNFYRDCSGIVPPDSILLSCTNTCGYTSVQSYLNRVQVTQISQTCSTALTTCNGGSYTGIEEWVYERIIFLAGPCAEWTFSVTITARNSAITTLGVSGSDIYIYSKTNNLNGICDNSPVFNNRPVPMICNGQRACYNNGSFDADGDSLTYELISPRTGPAPSDTVAYLSQFSYAQPVVSNPPMTFNQSTGDFCLVPIQYDVSVMAILVKEYRNGVWVGEVERDIQVGVINCQNYLPSLTGINGSITFWTTVCADQLNCFTVFSHDPDGSNHTFITDDGALPGLVITHSGTLQDAVDICWTPTHADVAGYWHCFTLTVQDDACPYVASQSYMYCLHVDTAAACSPLLTVQDRQVNQSSLTIYPQPANEKVFISEKNKIVPGQYRLRIVDVLGQTVYEKEMNNTILSIDTRNWPTSSFYMACLIDASGRIVEMGKIIVIAK